MKTIASQLKQAIIDGTRATLISITTKDATVFGYTDHDLPLTVNGITYVPAPGLKRANFTATTNDSVSNQEFGSAWVDAPEEDLLAGKFDNADIEVAFCSWADVTLGHIVVDRGRLGVIQWTADGFRADMQSHMRDLTRNINFVFTAGCRHLLFSQFDAQHVGACTLNKASYTYTGTVSALITRRTKFSVTGMSQPTGWCSNGILTWTTGNNAGLSHEVKAHTVGATTDIELFLPTFIPIVAGDQFSITAGCDKNSATCISKFNNMINFGGFPHIQAEVQYR